MQALSDSACRVQLFSTLSGKMFPNDMKKQLWGAVSAHLGRLKICGTFLAAGVVLVARISAAAGYKLGPDSMPQAGVPRGELTKYKWESKIFPGTVRDYWVYVPAQY